MIVTFDVNGGIARTVDIDAAAVPKIGEIVVIRTPEGVTPTTVTRRWLALTIDENGKVMPNLGIHLESGHP